MMSQMNSLQMATGLKGLNTRHKNNKLYECTFALGGFSLLKVIIYYTNLVDSYFTFIQLVQNDHQRQLLADIRRREARLKKGDAAREADRKK